MAKASQKKKLLMPEEKLDEALIPNTEVPYSVPSNWCWTKMGVVAKWGSGGTPSRKNAEYYNGTIPWVKTGELNDDYIWETEEHISEQAIADSSAKVFPINTIIIAMYGATIGKVGILGLEATTNQACACGVSSAALLYKYLFYYARSQKEAFIGMGKGGAQPNISQEIIKEHPIPLPPLTEQQRIVDRIESLFAKLDEAKEKAQVVVDGFEDRKAAILHKAFTGELTEKWRYNNGVTLESWNTENLEESFDVSGGIQKQPSRMPDKNPVPYITVANVYRNRIDLTDLRYFEVFPGELEKLQLKYGDILIVEGNGSGSEIGRCAMWRNELPVCIHQNHIIRVRRKNESVLPEYVLYYLNSSTGRQIMKSRAKTTAGLYNLSTGKIKTIPIPYASLGEQKEIVRMLGYLLEKEQQVKDKAETTIEEIDNMKKSILARAFRGELCTNDPNDESAIELLRRILK